MPTRKAEQQVPISFQLDSALHQVIKRLALEKSLERNHRVSIRMLLGEALWDLAEKYGKITPDERSLKDGAG